MQHMRLHCTALHCTHHLFDNLMHVRLPHVVFVRAVCNYEALGLIVLELRPLLSYVIRFADCIFE